MFAIIGIVLVFGAVIAGFLMEKGHLAVLFQPSEVIIIGGAAIGTLLIANPMHTLKGIISGLTGAFGSSHFGKDRYVSSLKMMYELLNKVRRSGMLSIEADIEKPDESEIFKAYPDFIKDHHVRHFVCDTLRVLMISFIKGNAPVQAVEIARRAIPTHVRPTFEEVEAACTGKAAAAVEGEQKIA